MAIRINNLHPLLPCRSSDGKRGKESEGVNGRKNIKHMYTVDYFLNKFEAIPEDNWTTGVFQAGMKCCANGHCGITADNSAKPNQEATALAELLSPLAKLHMHSYDGRIIFAVTANINDGFVCEYQQETPKQRILAALRDIKKMQAKELVLS